MVFVWTMDTDLEFWLDVDMNGKITYIGYIWTWMLDVDNCRYTFIAMLNSVIQTVLAGKGVNSGARHR